MLSISSSSWRTCLCSMPSIHSFLSSSLLQWSSILQDRRFSFTCSKRVSWNPDKKDTILVHKVHFCNITAYKQKHFRSRYYYKLEFSTGLKITTRPDPARGFLSPNPTQPDTPAWIVCPNTARTRLPRAPALFSLRVNLPVASLLLANSILPQPGYRREYVMQRHQVCVCTSPWSRQPDSWSSSHVNSDD